MTTRMGVYSFFSYYFPFTFLLIYFLYDTAKAKAEPVQVAERTYKEADIILDAGLGCLVSMQQMHPCVDTEDIGEVIGE